ncbi:uncharacterized protein [Miscanthus floridulus]|uniref:uncharacterized protein n=1 Tax=Miscanthus floridulus TaxID=154761 RepID=UPI0034583F3A
MAAATQFNATAGILLLFNKTWCATPDATLVANFTVSGDLRNTERLMVTTTVLMTILGAALFALCLVGRISGRHRGGHSTATRLFFRASFALFLPFMSYMFSQARSKGAPARASLILLWMLLVELLRKKVYAMVAPAGDAFALGVGRYSFFDAVEEAARVVWIGYLIYSYVHGAALKSAFIILWIFSVVKLCKRAICIEKAKRSFDLAKNASLVSGYMSQLVQADRQLFPAPAPGGAAADGRTRGNVLSACNYVVMGESQLERQETPYGFRLPELDDILDGQRSEVAVPAGAGAASETTTKLIRVCDVWQLADNDLLFRYDEKRKRKLQDTCLGLALFKLLRRRIEGHHMVEAGPAGRSQARALVRDGLLGELGAERAFNVVEQELTFLEEYYQAIIPLALPWPQLFFANFVFSILFVVLYCVAVMLVTGNGDMFRVLASLFHGLVSVSTDMVLQYKCFAHQTSVLIGMVLSSSDLIVTFLLTLTLLTVETYEFVQYLLSDWHLASILCSYGRRLSLRRQSSVRRAVKAALWINKRSNPVIKVHQFTVLKLHQLHPRRVWMLLSRLLKRRLVGLPDVVLTVQAKEGIAAVLKDVLLDLDDENAEGQYSNGTKALRRGGFRHLEWACDQSGGAATVILVWHLATTLLEASDGGKNHPVPPAGEAAMTLSRYCAYLVAYEPRLLPDDPAWTEKAYRDIKGELAGFFQSCCTCTSADRRKRLMAAGFSREDITVSTAMEKGVMLARALEREIGSSTATHVHSERVWGMLLELWAELLVFVARSPSGGPDAHALALANGGEFVTHIWAMLTHAGVQAYVPDHRDTNVQYTDIPISPAGTAV